MAEGMEQEPRDISPHVPLSEPPIITVPPDDDPLDDHGNGKNGGKGTGPITADGKSFVEAEILRKELSQKLMDAVDDHYVARKDAEAIQKAYAKHWDEPGWYRSEISWVVEQIRNGKELMAVNTGERKEDGNAGDEMDGLGIAEETVSTPMTLSGRTARSGGRLPTPSIRGRTFRSRRWCGRRQEATWHEDAHEGRRRSVRYRASR